MEDVRFKEYRIYVANRRDANNAIIALLAGSRLAAHSLQLTAGSQRLLPEIFPAVSHIYRFNLKTEVARSLLNNADEHLGGLAIPYALALHEDFVTTSLDVLSNAGTTLLTSGKSIRAWNMHEVLFRSAAYPEPQLALSQFHFLREVRNAVIHSGGAVSDRLRAAAAGMSTAAATAWEKLTGRSPAAVISTGNVTLTVGDIFAVFAIAKSLGLEVNRAMQKAIPRSEWAKLLIDDFAAESKRTLNSDAWMRALRGYSRQLYSPIQLTDAELEAAAIMAGVWRRPSNSPQSRKKV